MFIGSKTPRVVTATVAVLDVPPQVLSRNVTYGTSFGDGKSCGATGGLKLFGTMVYILDVSVQGLWRVVTLCADRQMGPGKKDERTKEEAIRTHWSMDPVHANLHFYYKLARNLLDAHKNFKTGKAGKAINKRARSSSTTTESEEGSSNNSNPPKKKREEHKGRTAGSNKDFRHWPLSRPTYEPERGYGYPYQQHRQENSYGYDRRGPPTHDYGQHST